MPACVCLKNRQLITVDWNMIEIKNNCDFDSTLQIVDYLRCKINTNFYKLLLTID